MGSCQSKPTASESSGRKVRVPNSKKKKASAGNTGAAAATTTTNTVVATNKPKKLTPSGQPNTPKRETNIDITKKSSTTTPAKRVSMPAEVQKENGNGAPKRALSSFKSIRFGQAATNIDKITERVDAAIALLEREYGMGSPTQKGDIVVVMEGWNKCLAFDTLFSEALFNRWRLLVAIDELRSEKEDGGDSKADPAEKDNQIILKAINLLEFGNDPLAVLLGTRVSHGQKLLMGMLDYTVRGLCPHIQRVQREAYRPFIDDWNHKAEGEQSEMAKLGLTHGTSEEFMRTFARVGVLPNHWVLFCEAFLWSMKTHNPYSNEQDNEDLNEKPTAESAYAHFVSTHVAKKAIDGIVQLHEELSKPLYTVAVKRFWQRISQGDASKALIGETFYRQLLTNHPELMDYFSNTDMDSLSLHLVMTLDLLVKSADQIGEGGTSFRRVCEHLGEMHRRMNIPTHAFPIIGGQLLKTLTPFVVEEAELTKDDEAPVTVEALTGAFAVLYTELMSLVAHPMQREEKLIAEAEEFINAVAAELGWSKSDLEDRLLEAKLEISASGTYTHTSEEIEIGARLAWRNSAKCIGRIAWNTLEVRDCRHVTKPEDIFNEVLEHLRIATCGTNIQSVMTVFRPRAVNEAWGIRFLSSQFVRYAGYKLEEGETHPEANPDGILGDPANLEFTEYLVERNLWTPPEKKGAFNVLPVILKIPGVHKPYVYQLPKEFVHEVEIEHPKCAAVKDLGIRWAAVPAISNFNMNLGGINYNCCPFNGWFASIEIVRNLMERYQVNDRWMQAMKLDKDERMIEMRVQHELEVAILHSFDKAGFSIVDPCTVGKSFLVHAKREREQGRECPGQWSWIGGLVGPTNVTWHHEMRDFYVAPQYEYASEPWMVTNIEGTNLADADEAAPDSGDGQFEAVSLPKVLILYGSQTGTAEAAANKLGRQLKLLKPLVMSLNSAAGLSIVKKRAITHLFVVCSTFNRGEFPSNAEVFETTAIEEGLLSKTRTAILALGSTSYPDFCAAGIAIDRMLQKAGGKSMMNLTKVDDATGSALPIQQWVELVERLVLPKHLAAVIMERNKTATAPPQHYIKWTVDNEGCGQELQRFIWSEKDNASLCVRNDELMGNGDVKSRSTRQITFQLPEGVTYITGDHLSVRPLNSLEMVVRFATCFSEELLASAKETTKCPFDGGDEKAAIQWLLQQTIEVETNDNGDIYPASVPFDAPCTFADVLQSTVDFSFRDSSLDAFLTMIEGRLSMLSSETSREDLKTELDNHCQTCLTADANEKQAGIDTFLAQYPTVVDFFEKFKPFLCCTGVYPGQKTPIISLANLLVVSTKLHERYYSISSTPRDKANEVSVSVGVVNVKTSANVTIHGVCSNYLARLVAGADRANVSIRTSSFRGPADYNSPVIMIGPGTGLAPMMGFLQDRAIDMSDGQGETKTNADGDDDDDDVGGCHLFFGCRTHDERIYATKVDDWQKDGILRLHLALSRDMTLPRTYVQDLIRSNGQVMAKLLQSDETYYYVCGDARIANECFEACIDVLRKHGGMSRVGAVQHLRKKRSQGKLQQDLWGIFTGFNEKKRIRRKKKQTAKAWLMSFSEEE